MTTDRFGPLPPAGPTPPGRPARRGPGGGQVFLGVLLILVGAFWLLDLTGVAVPWQAVLPSALIAVGLATIVGARRGHQAGLITIGVILTALLALLSAVDTNFDLPLTGGVGDRTEHPVTAVRAEPYGLAVGQLTVDLRDVPLPAGATTTVKARVGVGRLAVQVPQGVALQVDARSGLGQVQALGRNEEGTAVRLEARSGDWSDADRRLVLDLRVGVGQIEVQQ